MQALSTSEAREAKSCRLDHDLRAGEKSLKSVRIIPPAPMFKSFSGNVRRWAPSAKMRRVLNNFTSIGWKYKKILFLVMEMLIQTKIEVVRLRMNEKLIEREKDKDQRRNEL